MTEHSNGTHPDFAYQFLVMEQEVIRSMAAILQAVVSEREQWTREDIFKELDRIEQHYLDNNRLNAISQGYSVDAVGDIILPPVGTLKQFGVRKGSLSEALAEGQWSMGGISDGDERT